METKTLIQLFETTVKNLPDNALLWEKQGGEYQKTTYKEAHQEVSRFAAGLLAIGIQKGDRLALLSEGCNRWLISELGVLYTGAINVPLSTKLEAGSELVFRLKHSGCRMIIASRLQAPKIQAIRAELPELEKVIFLSTESEKADGDLYYDEITQMGDNFLKANPNKLQEISRSIQPRDIANISYTSGTTADPKGIMLSHLNYVGNVIQSLTLMDFYPEWKTLAFLPWDHAFAHTACLYCFIYKGASIASPELGKTPLESLRNIPKNIKEIRPDVLMSVPAIAKNFRANIESGLRQKGPKVYKMFEKALEVAYRYNGNGWDRGKNAKLFDGLKLKFYDRILFSKIRENFGGKLKFFIGGGALLDVELQRFFYALGIPMCQGYGLSEASPVISSNSLKSIKFGSSGKLVKYMELKILDNDGKELPVGVKGEIVIKGDNVMEGYWNNPKATAESIIDGWLYTGDMGYMDADGFLHVLGRFKSLLIANDGEKYSPEGIEEALVDQSPLIDQCMLYNNQNPYTVGLLVPNTKALKLKLSEEGGNPDSEEGKIRMLQLIQAEIDKYKKGGVFAGLFPERWLPTSIAVLSEPFTEQNHLLNSTMKMVRGKITDHFAQDLEYLYTPEAKNITNPRNLAAL